MKKYIGIFIISLFLALAYEGYAQQGGEKLDQVVAVVGDNMVLQSEVDQRFKQYQAGQQYNNMGETALKCQILEEFLIQKLLLNQARIDSIRVTRAQIEQQLERRLDFYIERIGSQEKMEKYFNRSLYKIKEDLREALHDQMLTQKMRKQITEDVSVTPSEINRFYQQLPKDSIPYIDAKLELAQIVQYPDYSDKEINKVKKRLSELRKRIMDGERFSSLAVLYSEGEHASNGGELGYKGKGELPEAYANVAFKLKKGDVSKVIETKKGYHLIKLIERRENKVKTRQILMRPDYSPARIKEVKNRLDSIAGIIRSNKISFKEAAQRFSEDQDTRKSGGILVNSETGTSKFKMDNLEPADFKHVKNLKEGEISEPYQAKDENGRKIFKIITVKNRIEPHKADLEQDYNKIREMLLNKQKQESFQQWVKDKLETTYIHLDKDYSNCEFNISGWK